MSTINNNENLNITKSEYDHFEKQTLKNELIVDTLLNQQYDHNFDLINNIDETYEQAVGTFIDISNMSKIINKTNKNFFRTASLMYMYKSLRKKIIDSGSTGDEYQPEEL